MKFPTGGGKFWKTIARRITRIFVVNQALNPWKYFVYFKDFKVQMYSKRTVTPTARVFSEVALTVRERYGAESV